MHNTDEGFIDIHSHTLWGIDDGAKSIGESLDMCNCAEDSGTSTLFLTPHLIHCSNAQEPVAYTHLDVPTKGVG